MELSTTWCTAVQCALNEHAHTNEHVRTGTNPHHSIEHTQVLKLARVSTHRHKPHHSQERAHVSTRARPCVPHLQDTWDMRWADDNPELFAVMEKTRMYIFRWDWDL